MYDNHKPLSTKRHWLAASIIAVMLIAGTGFVVDLIISGMGQNYARAVEEQR